VRSVRAEYDSDDKQLTMFFLKTGTIFKYGSTIQNRALFISASVQWDGYLLNWCLVQPITEKEE
jgi:hypothetical protein